MALFLSFSFAFCSAYFLTGQNNLIDLKPKQNVNFFAPGISLAEYKISAIYQTKLSTRSLAVIFTDVIEG